MLPDGSACNVDAQCQSAHCIDARPCGVCGHVGETGDSCTAEICDVGLFCDGSCKPLPALGQPCNNIGDTVNVASRVESATRGHGVDILVSDDVKQKLDARVRLKELPPTTVKGKPEPLVLWAVDDADA